MKNTEALCECGHSRAYHRNKQDNCTRFRCACGGFVTLSKAKPMAVDAQSVDRDAALAKWKSENSVMGGGTLIKRIFDGGYKAGQQAERERIARIRKWVEEMPSGLAASHPHFAGYIWKKDVLAYIDGLAEGEAKCPCGSEIRLESEGKFAALETAQADRAWREIAVDGLPTEDGWFACTINDGDGFPDLVEPFWWNGYNWTDGIDVGTSSTNRNGQTVIAYMPLPEPFTATRGQGEDSD